MNILKVSLKNCYGIGKLEHEFKFEESANTHTIYAGNGIMKTSFALTFSKLSQEEEPEERAYGKRPEWNIQADGEEIEPSKIHVIKPYQPYQKNYESERVPLLVANEKIREEFESIKGGLDMVKQEIIDALAVKSSIKDKDDLEQKLKHDIGMHDNDPNNFFRALDRVEKEIEDDLEKYSDLKYNEIFNDKTTIILDDPEFQKLISSYIENYNNLLEASNFFKKGVFGPANADDITKELEKKGYFKASHQLRLKLGPKIVDIENKDDLVEFIKNEKQQIMQDSTLEEQFNKMQSMLSRNQNLRKFESYLSENKIILEELISPAAFKQKLWKSYFLYHNDLYKKAREKFAKTKDEMDRIIKKAIREQVKWEEVIKIFNERFNVPFSVEIENKAEVILNNDEVPSFKFKFKSKTDGNSAPMQKDDILKILSVGEQRALYLLDIIYEMEGRRKDAPDTLYIIDDIADSFDYKNKYAIIEYLLDLQKQDFSKLIILTHNFDFHRTVSSRLDVPRKCRWHATRNAKGEIIISGEKYQNNPMKDWIKELSKQDADKSKIIASVPMMREIALLTNSCHNKELSKALHYNGTIFNELSLGEVISWMRKMLERQAPNSIDENSIDDVLWEKAVQNCADEISHNDSEVNLENKITLSIAIRLHTEKFIIQSLGEELNCDKRNRTRLLIDRFNEKHKGRIDCKSQCELIDKVAIMTPEAIHLNSFMYEPILDMSGDHLIELYQKVKSELTIKPPKNGSNRVK